MTIAPLLIFVMAVCLAIAWELFWAFLERKFIVSMEKGTWTFVYWVGLSLLGVTSGFMPWPPLSGNWVPYFFVAGIHVCAALFDEALLWRRHAGSRGSSSRNPGVPPPTNASDQRSEGEGVDDSGSTKGNRHER